MESVIISIFFFTTATSLGSVFLSFILNKKNLNFFDLIFGLVIGSVLISWLLFLVALSFGGLISIVNFVLLSVILILSSFCLRQYLKIKLFQNSRKNFLTASFYFLGTIYFFSVFSRLLFYEKNNLVAGWINVWGDWAAHLSYTASFVWGNNFPPSLIIFSGQVFSYPFMADFLSAILVNLGVNLSKSLMIPSFVLTTSAFISFSYLAHLFLKKITAAGIATLLFFLNGGLGFFYVLVLGVNSSEMTKIFSENIQWISVISSQFIPQRGFTLGFPL